MGTNERLFSTVCPRCGKRLSSPSLSADRLLDAHRAVGCTGRTDPERERAGADPPTPPERLDQVLRDTIRTVAQSRALMRWIDEVLARTTGALPHPGPADARGPAPGPAGRLAPSDLPRS